MLIYLIFKLLNTIKCGDFFIPYPELSLNNIVSTFRIIQPVVKSGLPVGKIRPAFMRYMPVRCFGFTTRN